MSGLEKYEFYCIDRSLTAKAIEEVECLSSRVQITSNSAIFHYNYGSFPGDIIDLLDKHFDAFFYESSYGSKQLAFCLPKDILQPMTLEAYVDDDHFDYYEKEKHLIINFEHHDEEGGEWLEETPGATPELLALRDSVLKQDYRVFYLAWLLGVYYGLYDEAMPEPSVPPGLNELPPSHKAFIEFFEIPDVLVKEAAKESKPISSELTTQNIDTLSEIECRNICKALTKDASHAKEALFLALKNNHMHPNDVFVKTKRTHISLLESLNARKTLKA